MPIVAPKDSSKNLVTALAWCFIALSVFGCFVGLVQTIVLNTVFDDPKFNAAFSGAHLPGGFPPYMTFVMAHWGAFAAAFLAVSAFTLIASIGLLKRRNWARRVFVVLLALGIVWTLASTLFQIATYSPIPLPPEVARGMPDLQYVMIVAMIFGAVWSIALSVLFGWLIKRLLAPDIVAEFRR